jgi:transcription antitermination protein NusB
VHSPFWHFYNPQNLEFMISRRRTREYLLQLLYARACMPSMFDRDIFFRSYFPEEQAEIMDRQYLAKMEEIILIHERDLIDMIAILAPKFELETMPMIHVLIPMIALSEILYLNDDSVPQSVSINEAIELAKIFSDDQGKSFVNGALATFLKDREAILAEKKVGSYCIFPSIV